MRKRERSEKEREREREVRKKERKKEKRKKERKSARALVSLESTGLYVQLVGKSSTREGTERRNNFQLSNFDTRPPPPVLASMYSPPY